ncbi:MAG: hypothetical protein ACOCV1_03655 [Bacillota bacterium]
MAKVYTNCNSGSCGSGSSIYSYSQDSSAFNIKQGDTCPDFTVQIKNPTTGNAISFEDWNVEVFMYFESCLKSITEEAYGETTIKLLGNANLCQVKIGDVIGVEDCNQNDEEFMLVTDVDFSAKTVSVSRGYGDSTIYNHSKGDKLLFYRIYGENGYITNKNIPDEDDEWEADYSVVGYHWCVEDTSHKGKYYLEFHLTSSDSIDNPNASGYNSCNIQTRTFPVSEKGYIVNIF